MNLRKFFFPYTVSLEERVKELTVERDNLLNRLLHAYSGYELRQPVPSYAEAQGIGQPGVNKSPVGDEVLGRGTHSTLDLMKEMEEATLRAESGFDDLTVEAARQRAEEDMQDEGRAYTERVRKAKVEAAAAAGHN
jgi:hypothetical protein